MSKNCRTCARIDLQVANRCEGVQCRAVHEGKKAMI